MPRYALQIDYHGGPFAGWQRQAGGLASVQSAVEAALERLEPGPHTIAAAGRTDALATDVPEASARQAIAAAVISAAKEHPSLGLSAHEVEAAERRMATEAVPQPPEHARVSVHDRAHAKDSEF